MRVSAWPLPASDQARGAPTHYESMSRLICRGRWLDPRTIIAQISGVTGCLCVWFWAWSWGTQELRTDSWWFWLLVQSQTSAEVATVPESEAGGHPPSQRSFRSTLFWLIIVPENQCGQDTALAVKFPSRRWGSLVDAPGSGTEQRVPPTFYPCLMISVHLKARRWLFSGLSLPGLPLPQCWPLVPRLCATGSLVWQETSTSVLPPMWRWVWSTKSHGTNGVLDHVTERWCWPMILVSLELKDRGSLVVVIHLCQQRAHLRKTVAATEP